MTEDEQKVWQEVLDLLEKLGYSLTVLIQMQVGGFTLDIGRNLAEAGVSLTFRPVKKQNEQQIQAEPTKA